MTTLQTGDCTTLKVDEATTPEVGSTFDDCRATSQAAFVEVYGV